MPQSTEHDVNNNAQDNDEYDNGDDDVYDEKADDGGVGGEKCCWHFVHVAAYVKRFSQKA